MTRQLHLTGFLKPAGEYPAGWRHPDSPPAAGTDFRFLAEQVRRLEAARFDAVFLPDLVGLPDVRPSVLERLAVVNDALEPLTALAALALLTERIGLMGTISTSYSQPLAVARSLASLDHLSGGRAGWNVVTSLNDNEARNFGSAVHLAHADRYRRAEECFDVVAGLWESAGDHEGEFFRVAGARPIRRPVQGRPVIAQAGSSGAGQALAARIADVVFTRALPLADALPYAATIKARAAGLGRDPATVLVLPELATVVAPTRAEAEDRFAAVRDLLHPAVALADVEYWLGMELASLPPGSPLPPPPETNASRGAQQEIYRQAQRDGLTVGDLVRQVAEGDGAVIGSPADVADHIEELFAAGAADGFTVSFPWLPTTLTAFTELVVPELQRRGLFRREYEGTTLRDHLGLPRP